MKVVYMDENNTIESAWKMSLAMWIKFNYMHNDHIQLLMLVQIHIVKLVYITNCTHVVKLIHAKIKFHASC
jgi:hypothetical protein